MEMTNRVAGEFTLVPRKIHGIPVFCFNSHEHLPEKKAVWRIVLRPTAVALGVTRTYFTDILARPAYSEMQKYVREYAFRASDFDLDRHCHDDDQGLRDRHGHDQGLSHRDDDSTNAGQLGRHRHDDDQDSGHGGERPRWCMTLPIRKFEVIVNGINAERVKNEEARKRIVKLQQRIHGIIEAYYHKGGAINPEASEKQIQKLKAQAVALQKKDAEVYASHTQVCKDRKANPKQMDSEVAHVILGGKLKDFCDARGVRPPHRKNVAHGFPETLRKITTATSLGAEAVMAAPKEVMGNVKCGQFYRSAAEVSSAVHDQVRAGTTPAALEALAKLIRGK